MVHRVRLFLLLSALWLLLSGHYTPLMLGFGVISVLLVLWITGRMDRIDNEHFQLALSPEILLYLAKLTKYIVLSNIDVTQRILGLKPLSPRFVELKMPFSDPLTQVIYANAITLTPGTASIYMDQNKLLVHTLSEQAAEELLRGDMLSIIPRAASTSVPPRQKP